ncbi:MAG: SHOCT domain-containing protein [Saccharofermentanales bacterium]
MKKIVATVLSVMLITVFGMAIVVQADEMTIKSIDTVMSEIRTEQGVQENDEIDIDKVSQPMLEELGDSVMEATIGNNAMHEQMDIRIGGEGSAELTAFHIRLGYNYLNGYPIGMMSLMSSGMMGRNGIVDNSRGYRGMMGNNYSGNGGMMGNFGWGGILIGLLVLLVFVAIVIIVIKAFTAKPHPDKEDLSLMVLKTRYAKGEITLEEYEKMMLFLKK